MIALFLLLSAGSAPAAAPQPTQQSCVRAPGSEITLCGPEPQAQPQPQQGAYRIPKLRPKAYGPALPSAQANLGQGVRAKLRGQSSNSGRGRHNRSTATLSVPF
jgi:hypothetical protein